MENGKSFRFFFSIKNFSTSFPTICNARQFGLATQVGVQRHGLEIKIFIKQLHPTTSIVANLFFQIVSLF